MHHRKRRQPQGVMVEFVASELTMVRGIRTRSSRCDFVENGSCASMTGSPDCHSACNIDPLSREIGVQNCLVCCAACFVMK